MADADGVGAGTGASSHLTLGADADVPRVDVHALPCIIGCEGPSTEAPVSKYFRMSDTGKVVDGTPVLEATLRGRLLQGRKHALAAGYKGRVLELSEAGDPGISKSAKWTAKGGFQDLVLWKHDTAPTSSETLTRALHWLELATVMHGMVREDEVERMIEKRRVQGVKRKLTACV